MKRASTPAKKKPISDEVPPINKDIPEPPPERPYKIHLTSAESVRRLLSSVINELRNHKLRPDRGRAIVYAASTLLNVLEQVDLSVRLDKIEEAINKRNGRRL